MLRKELEVVPALTGKLNRNYLPRVVTRDMPLQVFVLRSLLAWRNRGFGLLKLGRNAGPGRDKFFGKPVPGEVRRRQVGVSAPLSQGIVELAGAAAMCREIFPNRIDTSVEIARHCLIPLLLERSVVAEIVVIARRIEAI